MFLCPREHEDPAFRREGRLPNLNYGDQVRAVWVTRYDFYGDNDVVNIMERSKNAGFNTVFFQVRGHATSHYESALEPWSEVYDWQSPGFDPLQLAITEAHSRNMALHAWVNVMPMWRGPRPPSNVQQLYNSHPEWSWYDKKGNRQPLVSGFYVSLNPCWPEPRKHVVAVCSDIVRRYPVDGLHLDYIRFPNEYPVENGHGYPQDERTLDLFKQDTGLHPRDVPEVWDQWRCDCVTALLRDIRRAAKSLRPQLVLTAAVGVERHEALNKFQDVDTWWRERLVDALVPMNYTECHRTYRARAEREWRRSIDRSAVGPVAPVQPRRVKLRKKYLSNQGPRQAVSAPERQWAPLPEPAVIMGTSLMHSNVRLQQQQLALALQRFGHFAVFCYSSLFSPRPRVRPKKGRGKGREQARPQDSLLPFLQVLSHASHLFKASVNTSVSQHPFQRTRSRLHPEEAFPYEQLEEFEEEGPPPLPLSVNEQLKKQWGKRGGGRRVVAPDGEVVTLRRRTWRRNILAEHRKEEELWEAVGAKRKVEKGVVSKQVGEKRAVDRSTEWEAVRMQEAIGGEETV